MPVPARRLASGTIWVDAVPGGCGGRAVAYARVSGHGQRADLDRQVARLAGWATGQGLTVAEVVREVGSGRRPVAAAGSVGPVCHGSRRGAP